MADAQLMDRAFQRIMRALVDTGRAPHHVELARALGLPHTVARVDACTDLPAMSGPQKVTVTSDQAQLMADAASRTPGSTTMMVRDDGICVNPSDSCVAVRNESTAPAQLAARFTAAGTVSAAAPALFAARCAPHPSLLSPIGLALADVSALRT